jgi:hypothetical protein
MKDYLHSERFLSSRNNNRVFEKTYETISTMGGKITEIELAAFDIGDEATRAGLQKINELFVSDLILNLVNFTIEYANKRSSGNGEQRP